MGHPSGISFEFFPPRTEKGRENLQATYQQLAKFHPEFFSVTFGAGGSTRDRTLETVQEIQQLSGIAAAPHLSCIDSTHDSILSLLNQYKADGINRIVSLRGDIPSGAVSIGEFQYANALVSFIREQTGDHFHIEVAAYPEVHPQAKNALADITNFRRKVEAGADSAITQYFFNPDAYFYFLERCQKHHIDIPIVPGIMPITNYEKLAKFSSICGAEIPRWLSKRLEEFEDMESLRDFGIDVISNLCDKLLHNQVPGLHFYTLNQAGASIHILENLGLAD